MAEKKDIYELEQQAEKDDTHIPEYPFGSGPQKMDGQMVQWQLETL